MPISTASQIEKDLKNLSFFIAGLCIFYAILFAGIRLDISPNLENISGLQAPGATQE